MGLNAEVVSDINHLSLPYLPLYVTLDVKRRLDSTDTENKDRKIKRGYEWIVIRITYAESKAVKLRERRKEMRKDKHEQRLAQQRGAEE